MPPKKKVQEASTITTTKQFKNVDGENETVVNEEAVAGPPVAGEPAKVSFEAGLTLNLGNYESARITVGVVMPCAPSEVDATFGIAKEWTTQRLVKEAQQIKEFVLAR